MDNFLESIDYQLRYFKGLAEKAMEQLDDNELHWQKEKNSLNIATMVKHLQTNMLSRWTDFLTTDGEKEWRRENREDEFIDTIFDREKLLTLWDKGWNCFLLAINSLTNEDLGKIIYIRNEGYTVVEAIHRGFGHAVYHVGQIVYIAKMLKSDNWESLSIAKGESVEYNRKKFSKEKTRKRFE